MVVIRKVGKPVAKPTAPVAETVSVSLPSEASIPSNKLGDYSILLYGEKKIGKTSLASKFKDAFFFMLEPGAKALAIYQRPVTSWAEFKKYIALLQSDKKFGTVVIDTIDIAYKLCHLYVCQKLVIQHPSDEEWGKGWEAIRDEFTGEVNKLLALNKGVIFISHAAEKEITTRIGDKYHKIAPTMSNQARDVLEGIVDIWAYYCYDGKQRVLMVEGDDHIGAGHRLERRFKYTDGTAIKEIPMGTNANEAFKLFLEAFNNQLVHSVETKPKLTIKRRE